MTGRARLHYDVGTTWFGETADVVLLAIKALTCLSHILNTTFATQAEAEELTLAEWLADIDWRAHLHGDSAEGAAVWNPARALDYAAVLAVSLLSSSNIALEQDMRLAPRPEVLQRTSMQNVAAFELPPGIFDIELLLHNTAAFCKGWQRGALGLQSSALAFAGLIACQASQEAAPDNEQRYAAHMS